MLVVDVSKWQGVINWAAVALTVQGAIIRAGYGVNTVDPTFKENIEGALAAGLKVGVYWFMYGADDEAAIKNAKKCIETIKPYKDRITLGVWSDWEYDSDENAPNQTKASRTEFVRLFNQHMADAGYRAGTYLNIDYYKRKFDMDVIKQWEIWLADYSGECDYPCTMRQYTSKGKVNGINTDVDLNTWFGKPTQTIYTEVRTVKIELPVIKKGSSGDEVRTVQRLLKSMGYKGKDGKALSTDGRYGVNTDYAVKNYQNAEGLDSDGVVGAKTWEHLLK